MNSKQRRKATRAWVRENITKRTYTRFDPDDILRAAGWSEKMIAEHKANRMLPVTTEGSEKVLAKIESVINRTRSEEASR